MHKSKLTFTLLISLLINLIFSFYSFAQNNTTEEIMTFETYYPAPFGVYNEMRAKKMAIGDTYYNGSQYCWSPATCSNQIDGISSPCWPDCNTDLVVEGNVGIGTTTPQAKFDINAYGSGIDGAHIQWGRVLITPGQAAYPAATALQVDAFGTGIPAASFLNGNVGIGTVSPINKLDVRSVPSVNIISAVETTSNKGVWIGHDGTRGIIRTTFDASGSFSPLTLQTSNADRIYIATEGYVGIGTTNTDGVRLKISDNRTTGTHIRIENTDTGGRTWNILSSATGQGAAGNFHIWEDGAPTTRLFIQGGTGNVGIGQVSPGPYKLAVSGGTTWVDSLAVYTIVPAESGAQEVCRNSPTSSTPFYLSGCPPSSAKYKKNIGDLPLGLKTVMDLRPVGFNWKGDNSRDLGLVAEEVREVEPLLVTYDDKGELSGVKYKQLTAVLINAIKELNKRIEVLEAKKPKNK